MTTSRHNGIIDPFHSDVEVHEEELKCMNVGRNKVRDLFFREKKHANYLESREGHAQKEADYLQAEN
jgi:hypothetical protein